LEKVQADLKRKIEFKNKEIISLKEDLLKKDKTNELEGNKFKEIKSEEE
jgi:hypothetical protein